FLDSLVPCGFSGGSLHLVDEVLHGLDPRIPRLDLFECVECSAALVECGLSPFVPLGLGPVCAGVGFDAALLGAAGGANVPVPFGLGLPCPFAVDDDGAATDRGLSLGAG